MTDEVLGCPLCAALGRAWVDKSRRGVQAGDRCEERWGEQRIPTLTLGEGPHWEAGGVIGAWRARPRETAFRCQQGPEMSSVKAEPLGRRTWCVAWCVACGGITLSVNFSALLLF